MAELCQNVQTHADVLMLPPCVARAKLELSSEYEMHGDMVLATHKHVERYNKTFTAPISIKAFLFHLLMQTFDLSFVYKYVICKLKPPIKKYFCRAKALEFRMSSGYFPTLECQ